MELWNEAIENSSFAIDLDPKYSKAYLRRAKSYEYLNKFSDSLKDYQTVV